MICRVCNSESGNREMCPKCLENQVKANRISGRGNYHCIECELPLIDSKEKCPNCNPTSKLEELTCKECGQKRSDISRENFVCRRCLSIIAAAEDIGSEGISHMTNMQLIEPKRNTFESDRKGRCQSIVLSDGTLLLLTHNGSLCVPPDDVVDLLESLSTVCPHLFKFKVEVVKPATEVTYPRPCHWCGGKDSQNCVYCRL